MDLERWSDPCLLLGLVGSTLVKLIFSLEYCMSLELSQLQSPKENWWHFRIFHFKWINERPRINRLTLYIVHQRYVVKGDLGIPLMPYHQAAQIAQHAHATIKEPVIHNRFLWKPYLVLQVPLKPWCGSLVICDLLSRALLCYIH